VSEMVSKVATLVQQTIADSSGLEVEVGPETALIDSGYLDSLTVLQLFVALQEEFGVELDADDLTEETFGTATAIAQLLEERQN